MQPDQKRPPHRLGCWGVSLPHSEDHGSRGLVCFSLTNHSTLKPSNQGRCRGLINYRSLRSVCGSVSSASRAAPPQTTACRNLNPAVEKFTKSFRTAARWGVYRVEEGPRPFATDGPSSIMWAPGWWLCWGVVDSLYENDRLAMTQR